MTLCENIPSSHEMGICRLLDSYFAVILLHFSVSTSNTYLATALPPLDWTLYCCWVFMFPCNDHMLGNNDGLWLANVCFCTCTRYVLLFSFRNKLRKGGVDGKSNKPQYARYLEAFFPRRLLLGIAFTSRCYIIFYTASKRIKLQRNRRSSP